MSSSTFTLPPEQFAQVFPFHILFDAEMCIVQTGPSLLRLCPSLSPGQSLNDVCEIERPLMGSVSPAHIAEFSQSPFILHIRATGMRLKGQMLSLMESQQVVFLGTPWITDLMQMGPLGLSLSDFALHDALTDFLLLVQSKNATLADTQKLAQTLTRQREKLRRANQKLETQYALTRILTTAVITQEAAAQILETVCVASGWETGVLWALDRPMQVLRCLDQWYSSRMDCARDFQNLTRQAAFRNVGGFPSSAWQQSVWLPDLDPLSEEKNLEEKKQQKESADWFSPREEAVLEAGFCCALAVPVLSNGETLGLLEFYSRTPRTEEAANIELVEALAHQIGQFLERKQAEDTIWRQTHYDALTGLPNRSLFMERLRHALGKAKAAQASTARPAALAILFLDLDNFKFVNDSMGHEAGDTLLKTIASRLQTAARPEDIIARLGGDEFTLLLEGLSNLEEALLIAQRIIQQLQHTVPLGKNEVFISASLGVAYCEDGAEEPESLLRNADTAMYEAKIRGKSDYVLFDPSMTAQVVERVEVEMGLRLALERQELRVHYQPLIDLERGCMNGVEALVRWEHPIKGLIPPGKFITIAEDTGLIVPVGYWVLEEACRQMQAWKEAYPRYGPLTLNVNLSGKQLQRADVVERVEAILIKTALPPDALKLEITESVMMTDVKATVEKLLQLKALGVKLAMDDFGTGYSSMASLSLFPLDTIKIDRAFINRIAEQEEARCIVAAIIMMAKSLHLDVTGEGIETGDQRDYLQSLGCEIGQGYYFAKPLTATILEEKIQAGTQAFLMAAPRVEKSAAKPIRNAA